MHNLAVCYLDQGRLGEAEQLFKECLEDRISILGIDHVDTLTTMFNLAGTYFMQINSGDFTQVIPIVIR